MVVAQYSPDCKKLSTCEKIRQSIKCFRSLRNLRSLTEVKSEHSLSGTKKATLPWPAAGMRPQWDEQTGMVRTGRCEIFDPHEAAGATAGQTGRRNSFETGDCSSTDLEAR